MEKFFQPEQEELIEFNQCIHPYERVMIARNPLRPTTKEYIDALFTDFIELSGDRKFADDKSIIGGLAFYHDIPVTIIGHRKGRNLEENLVCNFGMPNPEGYRKAERLMIEAEKFNRPIITFIDTPGAYPGLEAEARGQGEAIARCLYTMSSLNVPIISVIIGEGGSGGALALGVCDYMIMLENSVFSVLSPEGFSTILWKDSSRAKEAAELMKLTAMDLKELNIVDKIITEPPQGAHQEPSRIFLDLDNTFSVQLPKLIATKNINDIRYKKIRDIGSAFGKGNY
ncbi:MAG: acetyl-CoA carboxylase carboxyltransferase subunit alpha [Oscillospiraceae bacterium]